MRYALGALGVIVAACAAVLVIGWTLPSRHRVVRQATYPATPARLFALVTDVAAYPTWRSGVQRVEILSDEPGHRRFRETGADGAITYRVDEIVPEQRVVTRIDDRSLPFGGTWTYELATVGDGTSATLRITEDGEVYNPVFRFVSRFLLGHTATIDGYLRDVGKTLGQAPTIATPQ